MSSRLDAVSLCHGVNPLSHLSRENGGESGRSRISIIHELVKETYGKVILRRRGKQSPPEVERVLQPLRPRVSLCAPRFNPELTTSYLVDTLISEATELPQSAPSSVRATIRSQCLTALLDQMVRITTFNVWGMPFFLGGRCRQRYAHIGQKLAEQSSEIVCLQEMWEPATKEIALRARYKHSIGEDTMHGIPGGSGLCILTNFEVIESELLPSSHQWGLERAVKKGALFARLRSPNGAVLEVFNVHLVSASAAAPEDAARAIRERQLVELESWIEHRHTSGALTIVAGDFNVNDTSPQYTKLTSLGEDTFDSYRSASFTVKAPVRGFTFDPTVNPWANSWLSSPSREPERLDYILLRSGADHGAEVESSIVFNEPGDSGFFLSDHFGVKTTVRTYQL